MEARAAGLRLHPRQDPDRTSPPAPNEPTFDPYVFFGTVPLQIPTSDVHGKRYYWPNFRSVRSIPENALVHEVALQVSERLQVNDLGFKYGWNGLYPLSADGDFQVGPYQADPTVVVVAGRVFV